MGRKVKSKRPELLDAVIDGEEKRIAFLLASGADPNVADTAGWTALHFAAQRQDVEQIQMLLQAGAHVDPADDNGNTPLFRAVFSFRGNPGALQALKAAGADVDRLNKHGASPRSLAESIANYNVKDVL